MRPQAIGFCAVLVAFGLTAAAGADAERPHVLLISIDALRPDHVGLYGYSRPTSPAIDAWAADATVYDRAYAAEAHTGPSVPVRRRP